MQINLLVYHRTNWKNNLFPLLCFSPLMETKIICSYVLLKINISRRSCIHKISKSSVKFFVIYFFIQLPRVFETPKSYLNVLHFMNALYHVYGYILCSTISFLWYWHFDIILTLYIIWLYWPVLILILLRTIYLYIMLTFTLRTCETA